MNITRQESGLDEANALLLDMWINGNKSDVLDTIRRSETKRLLDFIKSVPPEYLHNILDYAIKYL